MVPGLWGGSTSSFGRVGVGVGVRAGGRESSGLWLEVPLLLVTGRWVDKVRRWVFLLLWYFGILGGLVVWYFDLLVVWYFYFLVYWYLGIFLWSGVLVF